MANKRVAIIGAGPAGLMAAEVLSQYAYDIDVYEQKPSAARKFLMAGKTGLNISHAEPLAQFIDRYDHSEWLKPWIEKWDALWIQSWMKNLGIESYVGTSGRIFPVEMKAAPLLRAWLKNLTEQQVKFFYRHRCIDLQGTAVTLQNQNNQSTETFTQQYDAVVLACGAVSWSQLGSDGAWQQWVDQSDIEPFQPSNAGVLHAWSTFMESCFGEPLKRVHAWVDPNQVTHGDIVITHYGLESGVIYKLGRALREQQKQGKSLNLFLDLLPDVELSQLIQKLQAGKKQSLTNIWRKAGLDTAKINLIREVVDKALWNQPEVMAQQIKTLQIKLEGFRPIQEAISCAGGVKQNALTESLELKQTSGVFCCGEMLDWDAPTGGYLLTACFATGRAAGEGVHSFLEK